jgi:3-hydroxyisobutyrate dehydrogenase
MRVGFIGTGRLGTPMVQRLLECGVPVTVWNRTASRSASLIEAGATWAASARALAASVDVVCLCLADTAAVEAVARDDGEGRGVLHAMPRGGLVIDFSSIDPEATVRLSREASSHGIHWVDAPVSGGVPAARRGALIVFAGGDAAAVERAAPLFAALAQRVTHMGGSGAGQLTKSCNQQIVASNLLVLAEMLAFAERAGIEASKLPAALAGGFADSLPLQLFGPRMVEGIESPPLAAVGTFHKDLAQVVRLAAQAGADVPLARAALNELEHAMRHADIGPLAEASRLIQLRRSPRARESSATS